MGLRYSLKIYVILCWGQNCVHLSYSSYLFQLAKQTLI